MSSGLLSDESPESERYRGTGRQLEESRASEQGVGPRGEEQESGRDRIEERE